MEKKNSNLSNENNTLKRMVQGEKETRAQHTNLPKPSMANSLKTSA